MTLKRKGKTPIIAKLCKTGNPNKQTNKEICKLKTNGEELQIKQFRVGTYM